MPPLADVEVQLHGNWVTLPAWARFLMEVGVQAGSQVERDHSSLITLSLPTLGFASAFCLAGAVIGAFEAALPSATGKSPRLVPGLTPLQVQHIQTLRTLLAQQGSKVPVKIVGKTRVEFGDLVAVDDPANAAGSSVAKLYLTIVGAQGAGPGGTRGGKSQARKKIAAAGRLTTKVPLALCLKVQPTTVKRIQHVRVDPPKGLLKAMFGDDARAFVMGAGAPVALVDGLGTKSSAHTNDALRAPVSVQVRGRSAGSPAREEGILGDLVMLGDRQSVARRALRLNPHDLDQGIATHFRGSGTLVVDGGAVNLNDLVSIAKQQGPFTILAIFDRSQMPRSQPSVRDRRAGRAPENIEISRDAVRALARRQPAQTRTLHLRGVTVPNAVGLHVMDVL